MIELLPKQFYPISQRSASEIRTALKHETRRFAAGVRVENTDALCRGRVHARSIAAQSCIKPRDLHAVFIQPPPYTATRARLLAQLAAPLLAGELFDLVPDTVFFLKDRAGRYLAVNQTLVERCGRRSKAELLGRTVTDLFPGELAASYAEQDRQVLESGVPLVSKLELHLYPSRQQGWCLSTKLPVRDRSGRITGLAGLSRDVHAPAAGGAVPAPLVEAVEYLRRNYAEPVTPAALASRTGVKPAQFTRLVKRLLQLTPGQLILQTRLQAAAQQLRDGDDTVATIASACGFYDHSALTRHFKAATGLTPLAYRQAARD